MVPISLQHGTQSFILPCRLGPVSLLPSALSLLDLLFLVLLHLLLTWHSDCNHPFQCWEGRRPCLKGKKGAISGMGGRLEWHRSGFLPAMEDMVLLLAITRLLFPPRAREEPQSHSLSHVVSSGEGWLSTILCGVMGIRNNKDRTCLRESKEQSGQWSGHCQVQEYTRFYNPFSERIIKGMKVHAK